MPVHVAELVVKGLKKASKEPAGSKVLVLGLSFKENVNDTRNSKILDTIQELKSQGCRVEAYDPHLTPDQINSEFGIEATTLSKGATRYDAVILSVVHDAFRDITLNDLKDVTSDDAVLMDIRSHYDHADAESKGFIYYSL